MRPGATEKAPADQGVAMIKTTFGVALALLTIAVAPAGAATTDFHNAVTAEAPILWYQFNEPSGNAINHGSLGATHDATYNGTILRGASTLAGDDGIAFDGSDDYLESLTDAPAGMLGNPTFSAEAIVFVPSPGGAATLWAPFLHW